MAAQTGVFALREAIVACPAPLWVTLDAPSTPSLTSALAADRSAETWRAPGAALDAALWHRLGMASDRGVGLGAGSHAAWEEALGGVTLATRFTPSAPGGIQGRAKPRRPCGKQTKPHKNALRRNASRIGPRVSTHTNKRTTPGRTPWRSTTNAPWGSIGGVPRDHEALHKDSGVPSQVDARN